MKINRLFKRVIATACAASMVLTGLISDLGTVKVEAAAEHTLWLVGDSTVCAFNDSYYYPRYGYGTQIGNYLDGTYEVQNLAVSGTSSKSFTSHANYTTLTSGIQAGDTLVVGFGHNDEKSEDAERFTKPATTAGDYTETDSFEKSLYDNYVEMAQAKGAEVILCTPIVRRTATTGSWSSSQLHVTSSGDYPEAIRALGEAVDVPVVDMTALTKDLYDSLGAEETLYLHAWNSSKEGSVDNTHLNIYGAKKVAWLFANEVDDTSATLASHISLAAGEPTKANDLESNPDYVEPEYDNNLAQSTIFADYVVEGSGTGDGDDVAFKGTAFGQLNCDPTAEYHVLETDENGNMHVAVLSDKSKITSSGDGIVMYYYKVPVDSSFSLSAKATLNAYSNHNQAAFGLMARDDMWIDTVNATLTSDYVAAGILGKGCNCFYRKSGVLGGQTALTTETIAAGNSYNLSIVSNSDGYTCTFGNEPAQSAGYDFALTSVDSEYVYIGMFAARNADVTYSNIHLVVDGETIVDTRKPEFAVTVAESENGTAKANKTSASQGETVKLTATPDAGYYLKEWEVVSGGVTIEDNSFVMPAGAVEVKPVFEAYRMEWDFKNDSSLMGSENGIVIQGTTGTFAGLSIDASNTTTQAKFDTYNRDSYAQVNNGTIITIPVEGSSKVTVTAYNGANFTVDGQTAEATTHTFICEGADNKVTLEFTAHEYLTSIKVVPFAYTPEGTTDFTTTNIADATGYTATNIIDSGSGHGLQTKAEGATMVLELSDKANVIVTTCRYGAGATEGASSMTASSGEVEEGAVDENGANAPVFTVTGADAGTLTLTFGTNMYIHNIMVEYIIEVGPRNIDVWDLGGLVESDTETYTNNITPDKLKNAGISGGVFPSSASIPFGDLTLITGGSDRLYTNVAELSSLSYGTYSYAQNAYDDGYTSAGAYYCNGSGGSGRRCVTIANVQAGDKIVAYMGIAQTAASQFFFEGLGTASAQKESVECAVGEFKKCEFVAEYTGTYKIWENAKGKPLYHRVVRVPFVEVSGTISAADVEGKYTGTEHTVKFVNQTTKQETWAVLGENGAYTANLAPGYEYVAVLVGATGYGFTAASRMVTTTDAEALTGKTGVDLVIEPKETYTFSGQVTGFAEGYDVSKLVVTLTPPADTDLLAVEATLDESLNFSATLEPDYDYTISIAGVNDYQVTSDLVINKNANYNANITVGLKPMYAVTGGFIGLGEGVVPTALSFENVEDGYTYTATVDADGYSINLRDGSYQAKATVSGYSTITHVVVNGTAASKDLMFVATSAAPSIDRVSDIYVGYPDKNNNYATVREAVAACAAMNPTSEAQRITVHIAPGTYREQVVVATPYVSFVNDTDEEVLITCYYGIGYQYYSLDASGYYNPENAYDKFDMNGPADWGATVFVKPSATAFRAESITFENSFNRYITDEELADGVEPSGAESIDLDRNYSLDVQSKAATERGAAMVVKADKVEFKDCSFLGSQDTLFTGNVSGYNVYFKNCFIEGQTDYIFGDGDVIFDACELSWKGYSANSQGGYITASKPGSYLFRNCVVTANDELTVVAGYFGRPWDKSAKVKFLNTRLESADLIAAAGWADWNTGQTAAGADYAEYNTTDMNGNAVNTSGRTTGTVKDAETAATWTMESIYGDWVPAFYTAEEATVAFATAPFVTDNGDINTPYPGHKLTVGYSLGEANDANDASRIEWYRMKEGAADVLVKTSSASVDKTYKITSDDIGYQIKVVVTPITVSGTIGEAASYTVPEVVREGYDDPDASGSDVILGDGVNVFLVGDSTVKDYSAAGIWSGGTARDEGAWGEFLQSFFDDEKVTVVNYANGGRSTRNFINEGSLDLVAEQIGEGDYMFIQFGHNDCSNGAGYLVDRYVPLGEPDANGVYPTTAGTKVASPSGLEKYGDTCYTYDCGGTFKWYLLQYIEVAKEAGAIPVLVTPVSRMYYSSDGTIRAHHDSTDTTTGTQVTTNNAYVTAVKQLAEEQNVLLVDGFEITKKLFEDAYAACGSNAYGQQIMHTGDSTHNNKLGGMIEAAAIASVVQNMDLNISYAVKSPAKVMGQTTSAQTVFTVNGSSILTAYDITSDYVERAPYWEGVGQDMIDDIAEKAEELAGSEEGGSGEQKPGTGDGDDVIPGTGDGDDVTPGTGDGNDKPGTNDGDDKPGDGNDKPVVNTEGLKVRLKNPDEEYEYTGNAIKPAIVVTNNGEELVAGVDYTVKYSNNVNVPTKKQPTITVTGKGNIAGSSSTTFKIVPKDINDSDVIEGSVVVVKNSKATPILVYNNKKLGNKDFDNADAKKKFTEDGVITITGKGNFTGTREIDVKVVDKKDLKKFTVTVGKEKLTYNGEEQIPTITVADKASKAPLTEGTDYIIVYGGSTVNAGTVKFTVIGLGYYSGIVAKSYKISPLAVKDGMEVTGVSEDGYGFTSKGVTIGEDLTVTYKATDDVLTEGKDYKISYSNNKKVGTAKYTIKFQGNYKGSKAVSGTFTIVPAGLNDTTDGLKIVLADQIYKGKPNVYKSKPIVDIDGVTLKASNYTVKYYKDAELTDEITGKNKVSLDADEKYTTIYVKIVGKGNYAPANGEYATAEYKVYAKDGYKNLSKARVTFVDENGNKLKNVAYTGNELEPTVKVEYKDGKTWVEVSADQYEVSYTNNVNKGKATVVVTGTGDEYAGSKTAKISIVAKSLKDIKDLWK